MLREESEFGEQLPRWYEIWERNVCAAEEYTTLARAELGDYDAMCELYAEIRMTNDPFVLDDYPDEEEIRRYLERGELYALRHNADGSLVGACILTHDPVFRMDEDVLFRLERDCLRLPGENWFYPSEKALTLKAPVTRPPLHPYFDLGTVIDFAQYRAKEDFGVEHIRVKSNLQDKAMDCLYLCMLYDKLCCVRRSNNEAYLGFSHVYRNSGVLNTKIRNPGYRSPEFEKLTEEEYKELLRQMGIDHEEVEWQDG